MANKLRQGFNTTDVPLELCLLSAEVSELFEAWRSGDGNVGEELADVAIYVLGLAEILGVNLEEEINAKMSSNLRRRYVRNPNGSLIRSD
jgi:NTP pyrophosphatase (non-canonical NTP hydrolase)